MSLYLSAMMTEVKKLQTSIGVHFTHGDDEWHVSMYPTIADYLTGRHDESVYELSTMHKLLISLLGENRHGLIPTGGYYFYNRDVIAILTNVKEERVPAKYYN